MPTTPTQIRIPDDVKLPAKAKAESQGLDLSKVVVQLLRDWTAEPPEQPPHDSE